MTLFDFIKCKYDAIEDQTEWLDATTIKKHYMPARSMATIREIMRNKCHIVKQGNKYVVSRDDIINIIFSPVTADELRNAK